jgi:glycosidase
MLDIDGFRFDKATQITVDAQAEFGDYVRQCARKYGKNNFFMPGEITGGNSFASIYLGRGRQSDQVPDNITEAVTLTNNSDDKYFLRANGKQALDGAAFHYSTYRSLTRFLGLDGNLAAGYDVPVNFVDAWNTVLTTNDLVNAETGVFDPRHMYGVTNQVGFPQSPSRPFFVFKANGFRMSSAGLPSSKAPRGCCSVFSSPQSKCQAFPSCFGVKSRHSTFLTALPPTTSLADSRFHLH